MCPLSTILHTGSPSPIYFILFTTISQQRDALLTNIHYNFPSHSIIIQQPIVYECNECMSVGSRSVSEMQPYLVY